MSTQIHDTGIAEPQHNGQMKSNKDEQHGETIALEAMPIEFIVFTRDVQCTDSAKAMGVGMRTEEIAVPGDRALDYLIACLRECGVSVNLRNYTDFSNLIPLICTLNYASKQKRRV
jgi:hypothetical protein